MGQDWQKVPRFENGHPNDYKSLMMQNWNKHAQRLDVMECSAMLLVNLICTDKGDW